MSKDVLVIDIMQGLNEKMVIKLLYHYGIAPVDARR